MTDNLVHFDGITRLDLPPERILQKALEANLTGVVVIGWEEGGDIYHASSLADGGEVLWLLEKTKQDLLNTGEE